MGQPLGRMAGHSNEVIESIETLRGRGPRDLHELSAELSAWMFYLGERSDSVEKGRALAEEMIGSGRALEKFREGIRLQGGDPRVVEDSSLLLEASGSLDVTSPRTGFLTETNCMDFGIALAMLGGGRERKEDGIDYGVGLEFHKRIGEHIIAGEKLVTIRYNADRKLGEAAKLIEASFVIGEHAPEARPLIRRIIGG
jgi:pyrimidine-nucleoside phosphorylase